MPLDEMRELRGYRRLYAITNLLVLCVFLLWAYLSLDLARTAVATITVALWSLFTLAYYSLLPDRYFRWRLLFYGNLADILFATVLIWFSGRESSPFFFVYLLTIVEAALALGLRPCFGLAAFASAVYLLVGSVALTQLLATADPLLPSVLPLAVGSGTIPSAAPSGGEARSFVEWSGVMVLALVKGISHVWANLAALWLTAYVAGFFGQEMRRVRASVQEAREKAERFSRIDWLTGLYNRRHFDYLLGQELAHAQRHDRPLSLLMIDSDNLKLINDTYGHPAGDQLLGTLAERLRGDTRLSDTTIRYGGDEFVVLLPDADALGAHFLAERLRAAVEAVEFTWQNQRIPTTITIGVATFPQDARDSASLIARADAALYAGKQAGRNRVVSAAEAQAAARAPTGQLSPSPAAAVLRDES